MTQVSGRFHSSATCLSSTTLACRGDGLRLAQAFPKDSCQMLPPPCFQLLMASWALVPCARCLACNRAVCFCFVGSTCYNDAFTAKKNPQKIQAGENPVFENTTSSFSFFFMFQSCKSEEIGLQIFMRKMYLFLFLWTFCWTSVLKSPQAHMMKSDTQTDGRSHLHHEWDTPLNARCYMASCPHLPATANHVTGSNKHQNQDPCPTGSMWMTQPAACENALLWMNEASLCFQRKWRQVLQRQWRLSRQLSGGHVEHDVEDKDLLVPCTNDVHLPQKSVGIVLADVPGTLPFRVIMRHRCDRRFGFWDCSNEALCRRFCLIFTC